MKTIIGALVVLLALAVGAFAQGGADEWILGTWEGIHEIQPPAKVRVVFRKEGEGVFWNRVFLTGEYAYTGRNSAEAYGSAKITGDEVKLTGSYVGTSRYRGTVQLWLTRTAPDTMKGTVVGGNRIAADITLKRVEP